MMLKYRGLTTSRFSMFLEKTSIAYMVYKYIDLIHFTLVN